MTSDHQNAQSLSLAHPHLHPSYQSCHSTTHGPLNQSTPSLQEVVRVTTSLRVPRVIVLSHSGTSGFQLEDGVFTLQETTCRLFILSYWRVLGYSVRHRADHSSMILDQGWIGILSLMSGLMPGMGFDKMGWVSMLRSTNILASIRISELREYDFSL